MPRTSRESSKVPAEIAVTNGNATPDTPAKRNMPVFQVGSEVLKELMREGAVEIPNIAKIGSYRENQRVVLTVGGKSQVCIINDVKTTEGGKGVLIVELPGYEEQLQAERLLNEIAKIYDPEQAKAMKLLQEVFGTNKPQWAEKISDIRALLQGQLRLQRIRDEQRQPTNLGTLRTELFPGIDPDKKRYPERPSSAGRE